MAQHRLGPRAARTLATARGTASLLAGIAVAALAVPGLALAGPVAAPAAAAASAPAAVAGNSANACRLGNGVNHVIEIGFDNVHFFRDNPNVPSDLQMMPHLLHFLEDNGAFLSNNHTPLIAHTADDLLTIATYLHTGQALAALERARDRLAGQIKGEPEAFAGTPIHGAAGQTLACRAVIRSAEHLATGG
jgi:hypothetical protein